MTLTRRASLMSLFAAPAAGALFAWSTNWPASATNPTPKVPPAGGFGARYFPNVLLRTHEGEEVRFYDDLLQGKSVIINMMYTLCQDGRCGVITSNLVALQRGARRNQPALPRDAGGIRAPLALRGEVSHPLRVRYFTP